MKTPSSHKKLSTYAVNIELIKYLVMVHSDVMEIILIYLIDQKKVNKLLYEVAKYNYLDLVKVYYNLRKYKIKIYVYADCICKFGLYSNKRCEFTNYEDMILNLNNDIYNILDITKCAAEHGNLEVVKYLVSVYDDTEHLYERLNIHIIVQYVDIIKYLYENYTVDKIKMMMCAAKMGCLDSVKYLHKQGVSIEVTRNYPIIWASRMGHLDVVKYLHINGADISARKNMPLVYAIKYNRLAVKQYLLRYIVDFQFPEYFMQRMSIN
jgi:hypothetical protein